jgi:uncharacterized protein with HEPN domain
VVLAATQIAEYIGTKSEADFHANNMLHDAVIMQPIVVGESVGKISPEFRAQYAEADWIGIINLRHRLAHDYFGAELRIVWEIATVDVPDLCRQITQILAREYPDEI